jgi:hypothetical protein
MELTLGALADLQAYVDRRCPDPLEGLRERLVDMDPEGRRVALVAAYAKAEQGPPAWGWPADDDGHRHFVLVALARHNPGFGPADAAAVVERVAAPEYAALWRVARGITPLDEIEALLGLSTSPDGAPITWTQAVVEVAEAFPGWTLEQIGGLTISQVRALRSGGKPEIRGVPLRPTKAGQTLKDMVREARAKFHGPESKGAG